MTEVELGITALSNCHCKEYLKAAPLEKKWQSHIVITACVSEQLLVVLGLQYKKKKITRQASESSWDCVIVCR